MLSGVSKFDPTVCETLLRWFCPKNGLVLDPFAGGVTRGAVAALMGFQVSFVFSFKINLLLTYSIVVLIFLKHK